MEHKQLSVFSFLFWKEKIFAIYYFFALFICSLFGYSPKKPFGTGQTADYNEKPRDDGFDYGRPHGWGGGKYKDLRDVKPCFGRG